MAAYPDYCPISLGAEVLGDRWTPLVIRELMVGSTGFNEIHRGVPRMSRTLLARRLRTLERRGLVRREIAGRGHPGRYVLTPAGEGLTPIVSAMGQWAAEWEFGDPREEQCDALTLMWRLHQQAVPRRLPKQRTVVHLRLTGPGGAEGWLDIDHQAVTVCKENPGCDVDLVVEADTGQLQRWLIGLAPFRELVTRGHAQLVGPSRLTRAFPGWFDTTLFAAGLQRAAARRATSVSPDVARFLDGERIVAMPAKRSRRLPLLDHIAQRFEPGRHYAEREVNELLRPSYDDVAALRRYLVDEGFLDRSEGQYWRSGGSVTVD